MKYTYALSTIGITMASLLVSGAGFSVASASGDQDLYYIMNSANLNTMNSYVLPTQVHIDPMNYPVHQYVLTQDSNHHTSLTANYNGEKKTGIFVHLMSTYIGFIIMWLLMGLLYYFGMKKSHSAFSQVWKMMFEGIWNFFEGVLGEDAQPWVKKYVVTLFFVILFSNLFGVINDVLRFFMPQYLRRVTSPTGEFETNIALALISVVVTLYAQGKAVGGPLKLLHEYIPVTGKGMLEGKGLAKIGDVIISMFVGMLDIVGTLAKIISLSIRLLGNMSSGSILLNVIFIGIGGLTVGLIGVNLQLGVPIIIYLQSLLSALIQAFVFALLVGIGITMAQAD